MATIADQQAQYFERLVDNYYYQFGTTGSTTTFDLYRRQTSGSEDDLGVPTDAYSKLYTAQKCTIIGMKEVREGEFDVIDEGALAHPILQVVTALLDVQPGDSLILAQDNKGYGVDRVARKGRLLILLLDRAISQV